MMLIELARRHPALRWPLLSASAALLMAGLFLLARGA
jgi:hypothetical protein